MTDPNDIPMSPTRPDPRPLYSFSVVDTNPIGAEDYYRKALARLRVARERFKAKSKDGTINASNSAQLDGNTKSSHDAGDPFAGRDYELVTVVPGNMNLVVTSGHGGTFPIPLDFTVDDNLKASFGVNEEHEKDTDLTEEEASKYFVPPRTKKQLPGFATVMDDNTATLAEVTYLELLRKLNPDSQIDFLSADLTKLAQQTPGLLVPHLAIARFSRRFCDANRPGPLACEHPAALAAHTQYHGSIARAVASIPEGQPALLLDIHGQSEFPNKLLRGTLDGLTVSSLLYRHGRSAFDESPSSLLGRLEKLGSRRLSLGSRMV